ncbi:MAG TPA: FkbM family methyltransferase [Stellaceae bacterium]|nr:FkbM family methyltransferase [Stellaceae bacterium]
MLFLREDQYIGRSLELYGEFSEQEGELFRQFVGAGHTVVEVGANIGAHTLHLAKLVGPAGMVLAFEPQRIIFSLLCANIALNEQFHVQPIRAAVGTTQGTIQVPVLDPRVRQNFGGLGLSPGARGDSVPVVRLDDYQLPSLRLLKIDVEGMEPEVLGGAVRTIEQHRPILYVENDRDANSARLIRMITELRYRLYWHLPYIFDARNFNGVAENIFGGVVSINMLCVPAEMPASVIGLRPISDPGDSWRAPASG